MYHQIDGGKFRGLFSHPSQAVMAYNESGPRTECHQESQIPPGQAFPPIKISLVSVAKWVDFERGQISYAEFIGITVLPWG